jgi:amino acid transporter
MFFTATTTYVGPWATTVMHLLVISSVYASQLAFHNAITRYTHALAEDGVLPAWVGKVHPRYLSPYRASIVQTILAAAVIAIFALAGADPYTRLLLWVNTPGVVGILVLQTLTAAATVVYFLRRNKAASTPVALRAGILSAVLLAAATGILVDNIGLLTGASGAINVALVGIVPATLLVGAVVALRLRQQRPLTYAMIGQGGAGEPALPAAASTSPEGSK